jgi:hypothetical protein
MTHDVTQETLKEKEQDGQQRRKKFPSLKELWMQHKRKKPLGKAPGVRQSVMAIIKTSCEPLRPLAP